MKTAERTVSTMKYSTNVFCNQYPIVRNFVQYLAYYRAAKQISDKLNIESPFWCATIDAHIVRATIEWCKVFGSDGCNSTHWKKMLIVEPEKMKESFRKKVVTTVGISIADWQTYRKTMCDFRNKYVAHTEIGFSNPVPVFTTALKVAYAYDEWVRELIHPDVFAEQWLKELYKKWFKTTTTLVETAVLATKSTNEK